VVPDLGLHRLFDGCVAFLLDVDQLLLVRVEDEEGELSHFVGLLLRLVVSSVQGEHYAGVGDRLAGRVEKCAEDSALPSAWRGPKDGISPNPSDR